MSDFVAFLNANHQNGWLFIPVAIFLGFLHGLEPGHSKTLMAAFIITIKGTVTQAIVLGIAATISHTIVIWMIVLTGLHFGTIVNSDRVENILQLLSALSMSVLALWMIFKRVSTYLAHSNFNHDHDHNHNHDHGDQDSHAKAHAIDIEKRFRDQKPTVLQIIFFGLIGGIVPCPSAITILLVCLQLKQLSLGIVLVLCFSVGLAMAMVSAGVAAAISLKHVKKHFAGFGLIARWAPMISAILILLVAFSTGWQAYLHL
jgi:ABC-type nickel/cobalt efflux system permease component RcnA